MQLTTPLLLRKPCKLFASIARVCLRQLGFLVELWGQFGLVQFLETDIRHFHRAPDTPKIIASQQLLLQQLQRQLRQNLQHRTINPLTTFCLIFRHRNHCLTTRTWTKARTRQHWIQRITFTADGEQSRLGGHTHTHTRRAQQYLLRSLSSSKGKNKKKKNNNKNNNNNNNNNNHENDNCSRTFNKNISIHSQLSTYHTYHSIVQNTSPPSSDMICSRPSSCSASHAQAPTVN